MGGDGRVAAEKRVEVAGLDVHWVRQLGVWKSLWLLPAALGGKQ